MASPLSLKNAWDIWMVIHASRVIKLKTTRDVLPWLLSWRTKQNVLDWKTTMHLSIEEVPGAFRNLLSTGIEAFASAYQLRTVVDSYHRLIDRYDSLGDTENANRIIKK